MCDRDTEDENVEVERTSVVTHLSGEIRGEEEDSRSGRKGVEHVHRTSGEFESYRF